MSTNTPEKQLIVATVMDGYADRPPLGRRAVQFVKDSGTGRTVAETEPGHTGLGPKNTCALSNTGASPLAGGGG